MKWAIAKPIPILIPIPNERGVFVQWYAMSKLRLDGFHDEGGPIFGAENEVDDDAIKGLRHCMLTSNVAINRPYRALP